MIHYSDKWSEIGVSIGIGALELDSMLWRLRSQRVIIIIIITINMFG